MLWVDYLILGIVLVSAIIGLFRGFFREVISLAAWVAAFLVAIYLSDPASRLLESSIATPSLRKAVAGTGLFVLVLLLGGIVSYLVGKLVSGSGLAGTDRAVGSVFGVVRGAVLVIILMLLAALTPMPQDPWWRESKLIPHLEPYAVWVKNLLPAEISGHFEFNPAPAQTGS
jgi:membrane protein required for colicin V production